MRILDIDMDFFLENIENWKPFNNERVEEGQNKPWQENDVRNFLELNCGLSPKQRLNGRIVKEHREAYYFWRELIQKDLLEAPFEVIHVDAHSDLGGGDMGWVFIFEELLNIPLEERPNIENHHYRHEREKLDSGNYLLFAAASHWIKKLTFVCHPNWQYDYYPIIMKGSDDNSGCIQMKRFLNKINFNVDNINASKQVFESDAEIQFKILRDYRGYIEPKTSIFDYLVFCQSPSYTPKSADFILDVIKDYVKII